MKTSHREILTVLKAGGSLVRFEHAPMAQLLNAAGKTVRHVRVFTLWDMTAAGLIHHRWVHEQGDCEDSEYLLGPDPENNT